jgi:hypothetical protein
MQWTLAPGACAGSPKFATVRVGWPTLNRTDVGREGGAWHCWWSARAPADAHPGPAILAASTAGDDLVRVHIQDFGSRINHASTNGGLTRQLARRTMPEQLLSKGPLVTSTAVKTIDIVDL